MDASTYLAFVLATVLILLMPGPTVLLVVSRSLSGGRRAGLACVPGVTLGDLTSMTLSFAGLGAVLAVSATLFTVLKFLGAAYLIWLGVKLWREGVHVDDNLGDGLGGLDNGQNGGPSHDSNHGRERIGPGPARRSRRALFTQAYLVTATNPKAIAFYAAFVPQFLNHQAPLTPQLLLCGSTILVLATLNAVMYAWMAWSLRARFRSPRLLKWMGRTGAGALVAAGVMTAALRRAN